MWGEKKSPKGDRLTGGGKTFPLSARKVRSKPEGEEKRAFLNNSEIEK